LFCSFLYSRAAAVFSATGQGYPAQFHMQKKQHHDAYNSLQGDVERKQPVSRSGITF